MNADQIRESFQAAAAVPTAEITLSNGAKVTVQGLTIGQRDQLEGAVAAMREGKRGHFRALLVSWSLVADGGGRAYVGSDALAVLSSYPAYLLEPIVDKAMELSAITKKDLEDIAPVDGEEDPAVTGFANAEGASISSA